MSVTWVFAGETWVAVTTPSVLMFVDLCTEIETLWSVGPLLSFTNIPNRGKLSCSIDAAALSDFYL